MLISNVDSPHALMSRICIADAFAYMPKEILNRHRQLNECELVFLEATREIRTHLVDLGLRQT